MLTLLCSNPLNRREPDPDFATEAGLAASYELLNFEALVHENNIPSALKRIAPRDKPTRLVYRGWMLQPESYATLYRSLSERNLWLLNSPSQYRTCHCLPYVYDCIASHTMRTTWVKVEGAVPWDDVRARTAAFGTTAIIVKDFVKSRKHEWNEACFIANASDWDEVQRVVGRFVELQGDDLTGGLVFREFVPLQSLGQHPHSGMPMGLEYRTFYLDHQPVLTLPYWHEAAYPNDTPPQDGLPSLPSRFYTVDRGRRTTGDWMVIEVGDAQVSGLWDPVLLRSLHQALQSLAVEPA